MEDAKRTWYKERMGGDTASGALKCVLSNRGFGCKCKKVFVIILICQDFLCPSRRGSLHVGVRLHQQHPPLGPLLWSCASRSAVGHILQSAPTSSWRVTTPGKITIRVRSGWADKTKQPDPAKMAPMLEMKRCSAQNSWNRKRVVK